MLRSTISERSPVRRGRATRVGSSPGVSGRSVVWQIRTACVDRDPLSPAPSGVVACTGGAALVAIGQGVQLHLDTVKAPRALAAGLRPSLFAHRLKHRGASNAE